MTLNANKLEKPKSGNKQPVLEIGNYPGRLVQVITLGLQPQRPYNGQEKAPVQELYTTYELADEFMIDEDGNEIEDKPRWISEYFPFHHLSSDMAKSTKRYLALDPTEEHKGDWSAIVNTPCNINIVQNKKSDGNVYNNISAVSGMREKDAAKTPELKNPPKIFDLSDPDLEIFRSLPNWLQDKIKEALDFEGSLLEKMLEEDGKKKPEEKQKGSNEHVEHEEPQADENSEVDW